MAGFFIALASKLWGFLDTSDFFLAVGVTMYETLFIKTKDNKLLESVVVRIKPRRDFQSLGRDELNSLIAWECDSRNIWMRKFWVPVGKHFADAPLGTHVLVAGAKCLFRVLRHWHSFWAQHWTALGISPKNKLCLALLYTVRDTAHHIVMLFNLSSRDSAGYLGTLRPGSVKKNEN